MLLFAYRSFSTFFYLFAFIVFCCANITMAQANDEKVQLTKQQQLYIQQYPTIKVHAVKDWYPFNFVENEKASGYNNDLIRLVAEKVGLDIEFIFGYQWSEYLEKLKNKEIDVISNMKITPERKQYTIFTHNSSLTSVDGLLTREGEYFATDFSNIKSIAIIKGFFYEELLANHFPHIRITLTANTEQSIEQLILGNVDAVLNAYDTLNYYRQRLPYHGLINTPLFKNQIFNYLPKFMGVHKDNPVLRDILDKGLSALNKSEMDNLKAKWSIQKSFVKAKYENNFQEKMPILTSAQQYGLTQYGTLTMCVDPDWLPIEAIKKGKHIGIAAEFIELFSQRISNPIVLLETTTWGETLESLKNGYCDFIPVINKTDTRSQTMSFTSSYLDFPLALVTHQNNQAYPLKEAQHKPLGTLSHASYKESINELYPDADIYEYRSIKAGLDAVRHGEIYGFIDVLPVMLNQIKTFYPELKIVDKFEHNYGFGVAVGKDNIVLRDVFEAVIATISLQQKQQILNRWLPIMDDDKDIFTYWLAIACLSLTVILLLILLYFSKKKNKQLVKAKRKLERIAMRDYLTSLPNLSYFKDQLKKEWARARRSNEEVSLLIIDIDHFKRFNGQYGQLAGDRYLIELAKRLQGIVKRPADLLARFEDDEFIILLPGTGEDGLRAVAAEVFYMMKNWRFKFKNTVSTNALSISVGAACMRSSGQFPETELTRRAEQALYQAQDKGCDQMVIYQQGR